MSELMSAKDARARSRVYHKYSDVYEAIISEIDNATLRGDYHCYVYANRGDRLSVEEMANLTEAEYDVEFIDMGYDDSCYRIEW